MVERVPRMLKPMVLSATKKKWSNPYSISRFAMFASWVSLTNSPVISVGLRSSMRDNDMSIGGKSQSLKYAAACRTRAQIQVLIALVTYGGKY